MYKVSSSIFNKSVALNSPRSNPFSITSASLGTSGRWWFSINYVYGSGLQFTKKFENSLIPYSRLDFAVLYKLNFQRFNVHFGASILNMLNTENVKYNNFINMPYNDEIVYSESTPFTPILNINLHF